MHKLNLEAEYMHEKVSALIYLLKFGYCKLYADESKITRVIEYV